MLSLIFMKMLIEAQMAYPIIDLSFSFDMLKHEGLQRDNCLTSDCSTFQWHCQHLIDFIELRFTVQNKKRKFP